MKRHIERYVNSLYYNHGMKNGGAWKTLRPLGQTHVTKLIETSLVCARIKLIGTFSTNYFFKRLLMSSFDQFLIKKIVTSFLLNQFIDCHISSMSFN